MYNQFLRYMPCGRPIGYEHVCTAQIMCDSCSAMADLIAANHRLAKRNERLFDAVNRLSMINNEKLDSMRRMARKLSEHYPQEYIIQELIKGNEPGEKLHERI